MLRGKLCAEAVALFRDFIKVALKMRYHQVNAFSRLFYSYVYLYVVIILKLIIFIQICYNGYPFHILYFLLFSFILIYLLYFLCAKVYNYCIYYDNQQFRESFGKYMAVAFRNRVSVLL